MTTFSILDLTVKQTETIEREVGLPMTRWSEVDSFAHLLVSILSAIEGKPREAYESLSMRELSQMVNLGDEDPN